MKLIFTLPLLLFISCHTAQPERIVGGPCSYTSTYHPAKVIRIDSIMMDALFEVRMEGSTDTFSYQVLNNASITPQSWESSGLSVGKVYKLVEDKIKTGTCNPLIRRIELVEYKANNAAGN
ncbi:MAG: hypothetical protein MUC59_10025 [Saprospiraceae bacterium]|jgi:hypothetical protein|nr:hypothetical protein [Saprospiraceae bacterium]